MPSNENRLQASSECAIERVKQCWIVFLVIPLNHQTANSPSPLQLKISFARAKALDVFNDELKVEPGYVESLFKTRAT